MRINEKEVGCFMNTLYNTYDTIANDLISFFNFSEVSLSKPNSKLLAYSVITAVDSESVVTADMTKTLKSKFFSNNTESNQKRFWRFFNNKNVDIYSVYNKIIRKVINNISNVKHDELIVTLDHMFTKNNFVTLMFTLKIDNQGIPIWFRTERTLSNCHMEIQKNSRKKLFTEKFITNAIDEIIDILSPLNAKIIFLADRWFFNLKLLEHIENKKQFYCFRAKANSSVKILLYDKRSKYKIYRTLSYLKPTIASKHFENLEFGSLKLKCNLAISKKPDNDNEAWYIVTNLKPNVAIRKYKHRFGSIEMFFKSQKTNGFYLEDTKTKNLHAFETLYGVICIASLWLNIIGVDYIKNYNHLKNKLNIRFNKKTNTGESIRILSTFKLALTIFKKVFNSLINFKLKCNFKLYL